MTNTHAHISDIPPDRADGSSSWVHLALIYSGHLGRIAPLTLLPLWLGLVFLAAWPWRELWLSATVIACTSLFADWMMLAQLPRQQRSWGPVSPPLLGLTVVRVLLSLGMALVAPHTTWLLAMAALQASISAAAIYATWLEPFRVQATTLRYTHKAWHGKQPLRLLHISDLHFEGPSPRETAVLAYIKQLKPDLILLYSLAE